MSYDASDKAYCLEYCKKNSYKSIGRLSDELAVPYSTLRSWCSAAKLPLGRDRIKVPKKDWIKYVNEHDNKTLRDCARDIGIRPTTLYSHLQENGMNNITAGRTRATALLSKSEWIGYVESHPEKSVSACARDIGISGSALLAHLQKNGIVRPKKKERMKKANIR